MLAHVARSPVTALAATVIALSIAVAVNSPRPAVVVVMPATVADAPAAVPVVVRAPIHVGFASVDLRLYGCIVRSDGFWC